MANNIISNVISTTSFEANFLAYSAFYDGTARDGLSEAEEKIVDALYADNISVVIDAHKQQTITLVQLKHLIQGYLKAGKKCDLQEFKPLDEHRIQYRVHMDSTSDGPPKTVDSIATINEDGKIIAIEPFAADGTARVLFEIKFRDYFALYNGSPKAFGDNEEKNFSAVFSDNFSFVCGDKTYTKDSWMEEVKPFIEGGFHADILMFQFFEDSIELFEYKILLSGISDVTSELHSVGRVKDGKLVSFKPVNAKAYQEVRRGSPQKQQQQRSKSLSPSSSMEFHDVDEKENKMANA